jgi:hypothetical protein
LTSLSLCHSVRRGTGHFSAIVSTIKTVESLGAAFSSLCGEQLAEVVNYSVAFCVLSLIAILPIIIYGCFMPSGTRDVFTGEMVELLSVIPPSSAAHLPSSSGDTNSLDGSLSSVDIDSSRTRLSLSYERHHHHHRRAPVHESDEENSLSVSTRQLDLSGRESHTTTRDIRDSLSEM